MKLFNNRVIIKIVNSLFPGFGACYKCGRNWGWTKHTCHDTSEGGGLFLFCTDCDKAVTLQERWDALDKWKQKCIGFYTDLTPDKRNDKEIERIKNTEFLEFPR